MGFCYILDATVSTVFKLWCGLLLLLLVIVIVIVIGDLCFIAVTARLVPTSQRNVNPMKTVFVTVYFSQIVNYNPMKTVYVTVYFSQIMNYKWLQNQGDLS